jgi:hypothetical protein
MRYLEKSFALKRVTVRRFHPHSLIFFKAILVHRKKWRDDKSTSTDLESVYYRADKNVRHGSFILRQCQSTESRATKKADSMRNGHSWINVSSWPTRASGHALTRAFTIGE